ncbi:MAG TPA: hypothetical protein VEY12_11090, partial [Thermoplasmata archaeon]|nr:hypothetical protein [Thermoplasmata archaeon]
GSGEIAGFYPLSLVGIPVQLKLLATPAAIPVSGGWTVRPCLFYQSNQTCQSVDTTIRMAALLPDHTSFVQKLRTVNGSVFFSVPTPDLLGVTFNASYQTPDAVYYASLALSGPIVIPANEGTGFLLYALSGGPALAAIPLFAKERKRRGVRFGSRALLLLGVIIALLPVTLYLVTDATAWLGTGWMPRSFLAVIPVTLLWIPAYIPVGIALAEYVRDPKRRKELTKTLFPFWLPKK